MRNTGVRERNAALQLQKQVGDQWFHHLYASYFHTNLGVLRGSHIGNLTDLTQAFVREVPFFTSNEYRNDLSSPRQLVTHSLLKYNSSYYPQPDKAWHFTYGGQLNRRQEFDVRRGDRSDIPALDLQLISHFVEIRRTVESRPTHTQSGLQYRFSGNSNQPGTGILPLIPDYNQHQAGIYHIWSNNQGSWHWQTGLRYDLLAMNVWSISQDLPRRIIRRDHLFHRASWGSGIERETGKWGVFRLNTGITTRAPEVNELYSAGLHQGVSGIEEGNPQLKQEASLKTIVSQTFNWRSRWFIEASLYAQWVQNFIYLQPQDDFRLTIRGAFPVYLYEQAHARITGADITAKYVFNDHLSWLNRWAIVRGWNRAADIPLPLMPPDQLNSTFTWTLAGNERWEAPEISITGSYTLEQTRLLATQDFAPPPGSYLLWGATVHTALKLGHNTLHLGLQGSNLLNRRYRNYLNRLRYYADEEGTDVRMNVRVEF
ncbi:MAG: TonB-dependent receptor [Saprospiraceae bacterium]